VTTSASVLWRDRIATSRIATSPLIIDPALEEPTHS
jgi:hypothetical protein